MKTKNQLRFSLSFIATNKEQQQQQKQNTTVTAKKKEFSCTILNYRSLRFYLISESRINNNNNQPIYAHIQIKWIDLYIITSFNHNYFCFKAKHKKKNSIEDEFGCILCRLLHFNKVNFSKCWFLFLPIFWNSGADLFSFEFHRIWKVSMFHNHREN